jgi:hypothetical protein
VSPEAVEMLRAAVGRLGGQAPAAEAMGVSRSAVSLILKGRYPAKDSSAMEARIRGLGGIDCPHLGRSVTPGHCRATALGPCPTHTPEALAAWRACRGCPHRPPAPPSPATPSTRRRNRAE